MTPDPLNLVLAGVGGQGNVLASVILGAAALDAGFFVSIGETFGASQRGGSVTSHVRLSRIRQPGPLIPRGQAHLVVGLEPLEALRSAREHLGPDGRILVVTHPIPPLGVLRGDQAYPDWGTLLGAMGALAAKIVAVEVPPGLPANVVALGALVRTGWLPVSGALVEAALVRSVSEGRRRGNLEAFQVGRSSP